MTSRNLPRPAHFRRAALATMGGAALLLALATSPAHGQPTRPKLSASMTTVVTNYHAWSNAVAINNGLVEAIVVPTDGRVQQFRFLGDTNGALWENAALAGQTPSGFYKNFGGDKAWPSPQSDWNWPPPRGFDGTPYTASAGDGSITLTSTVDSKYNIRTTRLIELLPNQPAMRIRTVFERTGETSWTNKSLGVWIDCQATVTSESRCYAPVPSPSIFPNGYTTSGSSIYTAALPVDFTNANGLISFASDPRTYHKIGFDGNTLVLVGPTLSLRLDAPRVAGATYPDGNSSTEVYTASGNDSYFELEMMGPMAKLAVGEKMEFVTVYSLFRRTEATPDAEAQKALAWKY